MGPTIHGDFTILFPLQSVLASSIPGKIVGEVVNPNLSINHGKERIKTTAWSLGRWKLE